MLAPRASSAFVCIQCELKLARPRLSGLAHRLSHANFSSSPRPRDEDTEVQTRRARSQLSEHPLGRLRKRKGRATIRETTARLEEGVKTLGDDAAILVLKDLEDAPAEERETPEIVSTTASGSLNIAESLQQEKRPFTPQEIVNQIESLRPEADAEPDEPHYISQSTFIKLSRTLLQGFKGRQLLQYYSVAKGVTKGRVGQQVMDGLKERQSQTKRPTERSEWHPGTTQIERRLPGLDVHRTKRRSVSKHLLVDQILRDVWNLVPLEEIEASGELELSLKPWQIQLLSSGSDVTPLDRIGRERRAKVEIHWQDHVVRITADKISAEYAADDIEKLLQDTETQRFHLKPWLPYLKDSSSSNELTKLFPEASLQSVAKMTGANVQFGHSNLVIIRALSKGAAEEAERCLINMLPLEKSITRSIDTSRREAAGDQSYLHPVTFDKAALDFQERSGKLGRWILPATRGSITTSIQTGTPEALGKDVFKRGDSADQDLDTVEARLKKLIDGSQLPERSRLQYQRGKKAMQTGPWSTKPELSLSARFGQVLFPLEETNAESESALTTFLPVLPGLANILKDETFHLFHQHTAPKLEYTFVAAPVQQNFSKMQQYPTLSIRIAHNHRTGAHHLRELSLALEETDHEVLLPNKAVDIQFRKHSRVRLMRPEANNELNTFMEAVLANIESGERLTAPTLDLEIPKWTIPGYPLGAGTRSVRYLFMGVRFRQSIAATYEGTRVSYSSVVGGKLNRKGGSFSAHFVSSDNKNEPQTKTVDREKLKRFVKSCFKIADRITEASHHAQPLNKSIKPRNEMSARKERRRELNTTASDAASDHSAADILASAETLQDLTEQEQEGDPDMTHSVTDTQVSDSPVIPSLDSATHGTDQTERVIHNGGVEDAGFCLNQLDGPSSPSAQSDQVIQLENSAQSPEREERGTLKSVAEAESSFRRS